MKSPKLVLLLFLFQLLYISPGFGFETGNQVQDTVKQSPAAEQKVESFKNQKDSLKKMVPYLQEVESQSENGLTIIYMILIVFTTFMTEDLACIGAGLLVANGMIDFWPAAMAATLGIYIGDFLLYFMGRLLGQGIFSIIPFKWFLKREDVYNAELWFQKKGPVILIMSRFIPGSRIPIYLSAGILKTSFWTFLTYFGLTALIWTTIFVWISGWAGNEVLAFYDAYESYALWSLLFIVAGISVLFRYLAPALRSRFKI